VRFKALDAVDIKITVFWVVMPRSMIVTDVSEELAASMLELVDGGGRTIRNVGTFI
jgi:hypothetical protein